VGWLPLVLLFSLGFGQLFKWSQRRGCSAPVVVSINYMVLAGVLAAYLAARGELSVTAPVVALGVLTGVAFISSMITMTHALEKANVAIVLTAFRLAILVPIAVSVILWGENAGPARLLGIVLTGGSLVLMTGVRRGAGRLPGAAGLGLVLLIFALQGWSQACLGAVHYLELDLLSSHVLMVTALSAGLLGGAYAWVRRIQPAARDVAMGAGIGIFNLAALLITLAALSQIQGTVFFALQGCAVVLMDLLFAHWVWHEPLSRTALVGAGLGAVAMLLVL
jgi:drug/metabolite transporter (DMT)-like permease